MELKAEAFLHVGDPADAGTWLVQVKERVGDRLKVTPAQLTRAFITFKEDVKNLPASVANKLRGSLRSLFISAECTPPAALARPDSDNLIESTVLDDGAKVDRDAGIIRDVCLMNSVSSNGYTYGGNALADVARLAEGARCFLNHDDPCDRSVRDIAGVFRNVRVLENPASVRGDLKLIGPKQQSDHLMTIAEEAPEVAALSIHATGRLNQKTMIVEKVAAVSSVDIVAFGATTKTLFEGKLDDAGWTSGAYEGITAEILMKRRPDVAAEVTKILTEKDKKMGELEDARRKLRESEETNVTLIEERDKAKTDLEEKEQADERAALAITVLKEHKPAEKLPAAYRASLLDTLKGLPDRKAMEETIDDRVQLVEALKLGGNGRNREVDPLKKGEGKANSDVREMMGRPKEPPKT